MDEEKKEGTEQESPEATVSEVSGSESVPDTGEVSGTDSVAEVNEPTI